MKPNPLVDGSQSLAKKQVKNENEAASHRSALL